MILSFAWYFNDEYKPKYAVCAAHEDATTSGEAESCVWGSFHQELRVWCKCYMPIDSSLCFGFHSLYEVPDNLCYFSIWIPYAFISRHHNTPVKFLKLILLIMSSNLIVAAVTLHCTAFGQGSPLVQIQAAWKAYRKATVRLLLSAYCIWLHCEGLALCSTCCYFFQTYRIIEHLS